MATHAKLYLDLQSTQWRVNGLRNSSARVSSLSFVKTTLVNNICGDLMRADMLGKMWYNF